MFCKPFRDLQLSTLGMGNMRLPTIGEGMHSPIDEEKAQEIIDYVYEHGVNYFDTAYAYHGGESERFIGRALSRYPRDSWYLADKFWNNVLKPGQLVKEIFEEQLARCSVDYFDFYLLHNVSDQSIEEYIRLDETQNMMAYLESEKEAGRIGYLGFSCHSSTENMVRLLEYYPKFDFVQIQLNYADWMLQDAKRKYEILAERGIPVMVMEPCRGGKLASLGKETDARLKRARPDDSIASWAFRFVQSLPNVLVVLSGMTTLEQAKDNVKTFSEPRPLAAKEHALLQEAITPLLTQIPCTACRYCCEGEGCPQKLDIPRLLGMYNEYLFSKDHTIMMGIMAMSPDELPANCVNCGQCVRACPQAIGIPAIMRTFAGVIEELSKVVAQMFGQDEPDVQEEPGL